MTQKKQKFNAKKIEYDGIIFDSTSEKNYYIELQQKFKSGEIKSFSIQPKYILQDKFTKYGKNYREITYSPDFKVINNDDSITLVDVKGFSTPASELRKKLFDFQYPSVQLIWLTYVKKYGGWIEIDQLKKLRKDNRKILNK
jgi:hypothetical protein